MANQPKVMGILLDEWILYFGGVDSKSVLNQKVDMHVHILFDVKFWRGSTLIEHAPLPWEINSNGNVPFPYITY